MLTLAKYSFGVGDRFAHQAKAQLRACMLAAERGADVVPVWNKSHREHTTVGSRTRQRPRGRRCRGARAGLEEALPRGCRPHPPGNRGRLHRLQRFLHHRRGRRHRPARRPRTPSRRSPTGIPTRRPACKSPASRSRSQTTRADVERIAGKYLLAVQEAGRIYRHIAAAKGEGAVHHRSVDGRDRQPADAARTAGDPGRHRRREDPHPDDRAEIHRPFQQGRRLRRRPGAVREGVQRGPRRDRLRRPASTACRRT